MMMTMRRGGGGYGGASGGNNGTGCAYLPFEEPLVVPSVEAMPGAFAGTFEPLTA